MLNNIVEPESGATMLNNIVDNYEQCIGSKTLFSPVFINPYRLSIFCRVYDITNLLYPNPPCQLPLWDEPERPKKTYNFRQSVD